METHERLKGWRVRVGLHQSTAATKAGFAQSTWSAIERGDRPPTIAQATAISLLTSGEFSLSDWAPPEPPRAMTGTDG